MRPLGSAKHLEIRRRRAIELLGKGLSQTEVARKVGVAQPSVHRWRKKFRARGLAGILAKPVPGRPRMLGKVEQRALVRALLAGATSHGWRDDLWTCRRVADLIDRRFAVRYHPDHVRKILVHQLGWSCQKPETRARERDEKEIRRWRAVEFPRIKKTPRAGERA